jgi:hypothetical protein
VTFLKTSLFDGPTQVKEALKDEPNELFQSLQMKGDHFYLDTFLQSNSRMVVYLRHRQANYQKMALIDYSQLP